MKHPQSMHQNGGKREPTCGSFGGRRKDGERCEAPAVAGTRSCRLHGGKPLAKAKAEGAMVLELRRWGLDGHSTMRDAGEVLLRLVTQSACRVEIYSQLLGAAYDAAERLRQAHQAGSLLLAPAATERGPVYPAEDRDDDVEPYTDEPQVQAARADLERIFATGGVGALIGVKRNADRFGRIFDTEEAIRGLARLEADERDRCANFAAKAIAAGLAERQVRLAEQQAALIVGMIRSLLAELSLSPDQQATAVEVVPRLLRAIAA